MTSSSSLRISLFEFLFSFRSLPLSLWRCYLSSIFYHINLFSKNIKDLHILFILISWSLQSMLWSLCNSWQNFVNVVSKNIWLNVWDGWRNCLNMWRFPLAISFSLLHDLTSFLTLYDWRSREKSWVGSILGFKLLTSHKLSTSAPAYNEITFNSHNWIIG